MKYRSFATLAALLAVITVAASHPTSASARSETAPVATAAVDKTPASPGEARLFAQASSFGDVRPGTRLEGQPLNAASVSNNAVIANTGDDDAPLNLMALIVAGFGVMALLALRRSPNK